MVYTSSLDSVASLTSRTGQTLGRAHNAALPSLNKVGLIDKIVMTATDFWSVSDQIKANHAAWS
ncbi:hypothetical protein GCM10009721_26510 [Terrabacter tumescens]|uniref:Uncharacterized protein n=1 Tax=Terrabacter tumescens TaxID=60443 RepID=A0ABQ2I222_9MICO|nr:hypothetical protein GCM10009721_26510 [Terrabacter tumescens]